MKTWHKILAIALSLSILTVSTFIYLRSRNKEKEAGRAQEIKIEDLVDATLDTSKPIIPEHKAESAAIVSETADSLQKVLLSDNIQFTQFLSDNQVLTKILNATTLNDVAKSKKEVEGLLKVRDQIKSILAMNKEEKNTPAGESQEGGQTVQHLTVPGTFNYIEEIELFSDPGIINNIEKIDQKLSELFSTGSFINISNMDAPLKATWTNPEKIILRWVPRDGWVPSNGYNLFRTVNGKTELIAHRLGSKDNIEHLKEMGKSFSSYITTLFESAELDPVKMDILDVKSESEFQNKYIATVNPLQNPIRISGDVDFKLNKQKLLSAPGNITDKIPLFDLQENSFFRFAGEINVPVMSLKDKKIQLSHTVKIKDEYPNLQLTQENSTVNTLIEARRTILTKVFVDKEFANETGFGYEDDLSGMGIQVNAPVRYTLVPLSGENADLTADMIASGNITDDCSGITVKFGVEIPVEIPTGLEGVGADNAVSLRWNAPESEYARTIISGYHIERRKKDESNFTRINDTPVAISYMEDEENNILFETPSFYIDENVQNGDEYFYRIQALDIFGRLSEYSDEIEIKVYKVTPPQQPALGQLTLSTQITLRTPQSHLQLFDINSDTSGVALPITKNSNDTSIFVIYRSEVYGKGTFGIPKELVRINLAPYTEPVFSMNGYNGVFMINPGIDPSFDTIYYDNTVEPGYYYKYWVAAVDSWNNESQWSESKVIGYPLKENPDNPVNLNAAMDHNEAVNNSSINPPGFFGRYAFNPASISDFSELGNRSSDISCLFGNTTNIPDHILKNSSIDISAALGLGGSGETADGGTVSGNTNPVQSFNSGIKPVMGLSLSESVRLDNSLAPETMGLGIDNLPKLKDVHEIIVLTANDLTANDYAQFTWNHYNGEGLAAYNVYSAVAEGVSVEALRNMTKEEIIEAFEWHLELINTETNYFSGKVNRNENNTYIFMVCLVPEKTETENFVDMFDSFMLAGWIKLQWERPQDPQVSYFRVYRAEVPYFKENEDLSKLKWNMVADNLKYTVYSEKVDQTYAHYYYYKVASVSVWGLESENGTITKYRVPSTVPPQAPTMLVPFSKKETNQVNWLGVTHANKYIIYRKRIPKINERDLQEIQSRAPDLYAQLFNLEMYRDTLTEMAYNGQPAAETIVAANGNSSVELTLPSASISNIHNIIGLESRFKTMQNIDFNTFKSNISDVSVTNKQDIFKTITDKYGVLALLPYSSLDKETAGTIEWTKIAEIEIPLGEDSSGERTFLDENVIFGYTYLYTVQAVNDDNLASDRPEPVSVFTRKGRPFPPVTNLNWTTNSTNYPTIYWDPPKDPNLTVEESQEYMENYIFDGDRTRNTAGYLVYRSNTRDGEYFLVSGLVTQSTAFTHIGASVLNDNWYKVKVVDTAGYISDFSEPLYVKQDNTLEDMIPLFEKITAYTEHDSFTDTFLSALGSFFSKFAEFMTLDSVTSNLYQPALSFSNFKTVTPTPKLQLATPTPTPKLQLVTPTPQIQQNTPTPTPKLQLVTPTPEQRRATPTPTPKLQLATPTPTPKLQLVTPTPQIQQNTPTPTPKLQLATPTPTPKLQFVTPMPTPGLQKATPSPTPWPQKATPTPNLVYDQNIYYAEMKLNDFTIKNIPVSALANGTGEGNLMLDDYPVPVNIKIKAYSNNIITDGSATLKNSVSLGETGIYISELKLSTDKPDADIKGFLLCNNIGDLTKINFYNSRLTANGIIHTYYGAQFHYQNLKFYDSEKITINFGNLNNTTGINLEYTTGSLDDIYGAGFINFHRGAAENNLGLESAIVYTHGLKYNYDIVSFDLDGKLRGEFKLHETQKMKLVIPAGLCLKVFDSIFYYQNGAIDQSRSYIRGRLLTPFKTFDDAEGMTWNLPTSMASHTLNQAMLDDVMNDYTLSNSGNMILDSSLYYLSQMTQSSGMVFFPDESEEETLSHISFNIQQWDGSGFMVTDTTMTPSNVPLFDPNKLTYEQEQQQAEAVLGITPHRVSVDLRRDKVYQGQAPDDVKIPEWMGIVIKTGNVSLPPSYVQSKSGERIRFNLTPGELLYDQNGFCYQNQAYSPEGTPASFASKLGNFDDVLVRDIVLDLYCNIADLEIKADLYVPLLERRINVKMLKDDATGFFVCNVMETEKFDLAGDGKIKIGILGGFMDELGMHLDGTLDFAFGSSDGDLKLIDGQFNDFIIPSDMTLMRPDKNPGIYGKALFDKPYSVKFHDFPMEIRGLEVETIKDLKGYNSTMYLWGGMQLSDNLTMNANEDKDTIVIKEAFRKPAVSYNDSHSEVVMCFEDFAELNATGRPKKADGDFVEYDTSDNDYEFGFSSSNALNLTTPGFEFNTRIGYDRKRERCYFAVALYYTGPGIPFGFGEIRNMGGLIGYNMDILKNPDGTFNIPDGKLALLGMVDTLEVNKGSGNYFFAAACTMTLGYGEFTLGELRDVYMIVEKGPNVELGGDYYGPDSLDDLSGTGTLAKMGTAFVGYYHSTRSFKFGITLTNFGMYGVSVSGDIGFEMNPNLWELRIGHPSMLTASFGPLYGGFGFAIRDSSIDESYIIAKLNLGYSASADIDIVYVSGFLEVGGEGYFSDSLFSLLVYVRGGIKGGVLGHDVISLMLDAQGQVVKASSGPWTLSASARIRYHVDLLIDIKGSVNWHISKSFN